MLDRNLKAIFTALLGLMALLYASQNVVNLEQAYGALGYVLGLQEHAAYPRNLLPALTSPLTRIATWIVIIGETGAALLLLLGAARMWRAAKGDAATFESAKRMAKMGAAGAILVWFGLFTVLGGAGYQMWQTELGTGSLGDAFTFWAFAFLLLIYLGQREAEQQA